MNMDFGATVLAELNRRIRIKIHFSGSKKQRKTDLDLNPVLCCGRMADISLSHGENGTEVPEENTVSVPLNPPQVQVEMTSNRTQTFSGIEM